MKNSKVIFLSLLIILLNAWGCQTVPKVQERKGPPKIALVLGGGAARGFAHVGVIRVLEQEKIPIHLIVGTSVGSLIGALYASDPNSFNLEWLSFTIEKEDIFDYSVLSAKMGPVSGERLEKFVQTKVRAKTIEQMKIPFYAITTDLNTGNTWVFDKGSVAKAVRASSSIPGIFQPLEYLGRTYVDGGVTDILPVDVARARGADIIIAVSIQKTIKNAPANSLIDVILQSIDIMSRELCTYKSRGYDVLIEPNVGDVGTTDFTQKKRLMDAGIQAAKQALPRIRQLMAEKM
ncbi:MAG: patatin-like phospholipase family protein [Deltaproteobacteria bacterium]|nr:patatin-like phospholipase family protein [Deltaproteobacteria bacterium]